MKRVLVLNARQRSALAVTRSLGTRNIHVLTADDSDSALAGCSKYSDNYLVYPSPESDPAEFLSTIARLCIQENIDLIIPVTELTTAILLEERSLLPGVVLPFAGIDEINALADKCSLLNLAKSLDIPIPLTWYLNNKDELQKIHKDITYPAILKPCKSWLENNGIWISSRVRTAQDFSQAVEILGSDPSFQHHPCMIQQYIPGHGAGVFAIYDNGKPVAFFTHERLREKPPLGGVSVLSESKAIDPELESYSRKLLDHVGWHGVAMIEFRIDPDGRPFLMEVNTRFWGSLQLAIDAGVDFPWLLYKIACGERVKAVERYRKGIRLRWLLGDLDSLYLVLRDPGFSPGHKLSAVMAFITPSPFKTRHEVNRWRDLGPFWWELKHYLKDLFS